ncbi:hypothetical protein ABD91_21055 [Lysinibacillus sphaericus]|uniref:hypothetical protein n=1 Tax=Lysinibacillus sphaericus TaxID=1421 RepID=UPI0018CD7884|nr:hypothetical protein [Lysinibacillus sphaericus]MBG9693230.1 hypothetical protein [Lysinibacillus sphaericus]
MQQATKFFEHFHVGLNEVLAASEEIRAWFVGVDTTNITELEAKQHLLAYHAASPTKDDERLNENEGHLWFESKDHLALAWSYWHESKDYAFMINGYYFDDTQALQEAFANKPGWKIIPYV